MFNKAGLPDSYRTRTGCSHITFAFCASSDMDAAGRTVMSAWSFCSLVWLSPDFRRIDLSSLTSTQCKSQTKRTNGIVS